MYQRLAAVDKTLGQRKRKKDRFWEREEVSEGKTRREEGREKQRERERIHKRRVCG